MSSNEHPYMSGNLCDEPFLCDNCEQEMNEHDAWMIPGDHEHLFCSNECCWEWEEAWEDEQ